MPGGWKYVSKQKNPIKDGFLSFFRQIWIYLVIKQMGHGATLICNNQLENRLWKTSVVWDYIFGIINDIVAYHSKTKPSPEENEVITWSVSNGNNAFSKINDCKMLIYKKVKLWTICTICWTYYSPSQTIVYILSLFVCQGKNEHNFLSCMIWYPLFHVIIPYYINVIIYK